MCSDTEKASGQPKNVLDLASFHQTFTQWLKAQGVVLSDEHLSPISPSSPTPSINYLPGSSLLSSDNRLSSIFDGEGMGAFTPFSFSAPISDERTAINASSDSDEIMLNLDDFTTDNHDSSSSSLPELQDLYANSKRSLSNGSTEELPESQACLAESMCCFSRASKILAALHVPSPACLSGMRRGSLTGQSPPSASPRRAGAVLTENKEAMLALSKMLQCSCSLSFQLQLVMTTICEKMIAWYQAIIHSNQSEFSRSVNETGRERVLWQPITIGDYCLDGVAEAQITARVVMAQLKTMESLVGALQRRIKDGAFRSRGEDQPSTTSEDNELLQVISDGLFTRLNDELQGVREKAATVIKEM